MLKFRKMLNLGLLISQFEFDQWLELVWTVFWTTNYKFFMVRKLNMSRKDIVSGKWMKLWISSSGLHFEALDGIVQQTSFHFHIDVSNWSIEFVHHAWQQRIALHQFRWLTLGHFNLPDFEYIWNLFMTLKTYIWQVYFRNPNDRNYLSIYDPIASYFASKASIIAIWAWISGASATLDSVGT